jgi:hypothetical protein
VFLESDGGMALAPFLDLFNHSPTPNTEVTFCKERKSYIIETTTKICADEEIFISYGNHPNFKLWIEYGFIPPNDTENPFNFIPLGFTELITRNPEILAVSKDSRKMNVITKHDLQSELHILENDLSSNLSLLIQLVLWNPEQVKAFDFRITSDCSLFKKIVQTILAQEILLYEDSILKLQTFHCEKSSARELAMTYLKHSVNFLNKFTSNLEAS